MTSQGLPRTVFRSAIEHGNLMLAELTIREIGVVGLDDALELTALMAQKGDWLRGRRTCARWLQRYLAEKTATIDDAVFVAACLAALGGVHHARALGNLREVVNANR